MAVLLLEMASNAALGLLIPVNEDMGRPMPRSLADSWSTGYNLPALYFAEPLRPPVAARSGYSGPPLPILVVPIAISSSFIKAYLSSPVILLFLDCVARTGPLPKPVAGLGRLVFSPVGSTPNSAYNLARYSANLSACFIF